MRTEMLYETIRDLRAELENLDQVIRWIEALAEGRPALGRPPAAIGRARKARAASLADSRDNDA